MSEKLMLKCPSCNSVLELTEGYTGSDWECEAGKGSGYNYEISLECTSCAYIFPIGHVRGINDFSPVLNKSFK